MLLALRGRDRGNRWLRRHCHCRSLLPPPHPLPQRRSVCLQGPIDTVYEGGLFRLSVEIPARYGALLSLLLPPERLGTNALLHPPADVGAAAAARPTASTCPFPVQLPL